MISLSDAPASAKRVAQALRSPCEAQTGKPASSHHLRIELTSDITALQDGRFVITWCDGSLSADDTSNNAVRGQIFDPREAAVVLVGSAGDDDLVGTAFGDTMTGGTGNDVYVVDNLGDTVVELVGEGTDKVRSGTLSLNLTDYANVENLGLFGIVDLDLTGDGLANRLIGNSGANTINGAAGQDIIKGGAGADILVGGLGRDRLIGGADADTFVFNAAAESGTTWSTRDRIRDFSQSDGDLIDLSGIDAGSGGGDQAFLFVGGAKFSSSEGEVRYVQKNGNTIIRGDIDGNGVQDFAIFLNGLVDLTAADFLL